MTARRWVLVPVCLVALASCASGASGGPEPVVEVWDAGEGWRAAPRTPAAAPSPRWTVDLPAGSVTAVGADGLVVAAVPGGLPGGSATRVDRVDAASGRALWSTPVPGSVSLATVAGAARPAVVLEVSGPEDTVAVLDGVDGRLEWQGPADGTAVDATADLILVRSVDGTSAIERATGTERWRTPDRVTARAGGLIIDGLAEVDGSGKRHGVVDPATGAPRWSRLDPLFTDVDAPGDVVVTTASVASGPDTVSLSDPLTGAPRWAVPVAEIGRAVVTRPDPGTLLVSGSGGSASVALAVADGRVLWQTGTSLATARTVRVDGVPLVVAVGGEGALVYDAGTGRTREAGAPDWDGRLGTALYSTDGDEVVATDIVEGEERWRARVPGVDDVEPVPGGVTALIGRYGAPQQLVGLQG